jgi:heme exporter protein C
MNPVMRWFHSLGSPPTFYRFATRWMPYAGIAALLLSAVGLYLGLFRAPADYLQGESFRIIYLHVPSAWMSLFIYVLMAVYGAIALIWRIKLCEILMLAAAPIGAMFTAVTLITGMLWGKPTWGTYWEWDARMTSELVLLFLYFGVLGLAYAYDDLRQGARAAAVLALVGVVNVPIIHYSVQWWNTLHQGESVQIIGKSTIHGSMLWPLLIMALATKFYFLFALLLRARTLLLEQERGKAWARDIALGVR